MSYRNRINFNFKKRLSYINAHARIHWLKSVSDSASKRRQYQSAAATISTLEMKNFRPTCEENIIQFLLKTTFHGLQFVGNQSISYCERFLFLTSFITAFAVASYFIFDVYSKWDQSPIIVGISPFATTISKMPFPAITICNVNQALKSKVKNLLSNPVQSVLKKLCNDEYNIDVKNLSTMNFTSSVKDLQDFIVKVAQPCNNLVIHCFFGGLKQNCSEVFIPILTDEGLCCSFNKLHPEFFFINADFVFSNTFAHENAMPVSWSSTQGYPDKLPSKYYPRPALGIGVSNGLSVVLNAETNDYLCSSTNGAGFKISIHNPSEMPNAKETGILVGPGMEARIRINVKINEATTAVRSIQQKYRQCVFEEESPLLSYAVYSKKNCNMECDAKHLFRKCKCIDYYMPKIYSNYSICNLKDIYCTSNVSYVNVDSNDPVDLKYIKCNEKCLPGCFHYSYTGDTFVSPLSTGKFKVKNKFIEEMDPNLVHESITIINLFYAENSFQADRKDQYIGITEFLSYTGGLMGLFLGFSTISIIEIFYFCTLRPFFVRLRYNKELKAIRTNHQREAIQANADGNFNEDRVLRFYEKFQRVKVNNNIGFK